MLQTTAVSLYFHSKIHKMAQVSNNANLHHKPEQSVESNNG